MGHRSNSKRIIAGSNIGFHSKIKEPSFSLFLPQIEEITDSFRKGISTNRNADSLIQDLKIQSECSQSIYFIFPLIFGICFGI